MLILELPAQFDIEVESVVLVFVLETGFVVELIVTLHLNK